jgi:hypothetical protein
LAGAYLDRAMADADAKATLKNLIPHSASEMLDYAFAQALAEIGARFEVRPDFSYVYEIGDEGINAFATDHVLTQGRDGTVLFGLKMLGHLLGQPQHGDVAVMAVAAHEFGHIVAMKRGLNAQLEPDETQPFRAEQFADFMSGAFAGFRHRDEPNFPAVVFATTMRGLGGLSRQTHGTSEERGRAVLAGYRASSEASHALDDVVDAGFHYALSIS